MSIKVKVIGKTVAMPFVFDEASNATQRFTTTNILRIKPELSIRETLGNSVSILNKLNRITAAHLGLVERRKRVPPIPELFRGRGTNIHQFDGTNLIPLKLTI